MLRSSAPRSLIRAWTRIPSLVGLRSLSEKVDVHKVPLDRPLPGYENVKFVDPKTVKLFDAKVTVLDNGLTVVTEPGFGEYCTLGVTIKAGPRYEAHYPLGVSHFLEKLAFGSSLTHPDSEALARKLTDKGALVDCQCSKDTFIYASSCKVEDAEELSGIVADSAQRPSLLDNEMEVIKDVVRFDNDKLVKKPEPVELLTDWAHEAAFKGNTVGFSKYCKDSEIPKVQRQHILAYMSQYFTPDRIVFGGVNVDHDLFVNLGKELFDPKNTTWNLQRDSFPSDLPDLDKSVAQYTGGILRVDADLSHVAYGPTEFPNLAHLMIGFEAVPTTHPDFVAFNVLQSLLGGGGSFSAGGPGKGMFARLYTDVMNKYHWIYNATSFYFPYEDCGLFTIRGSCPPENVHGMSMILVNEYMRLAHGQIHTEELERAKVQLKSHLLMNLELMPVMFEDMARQVMTYGRRKTPTEYIEELEKIQPMDITRIAKRMLHSKPSVVGYGNLKGLQRYEQFDQAVAQSDIALLKT